MYLILRRLLDVIMSLFAMVLLIPIFIIVIVLIKITSKGPAIIRQKRVGKDLKLFTLYKFRTMNLYVTSQEPIYIENPSEYLTKVGKFLRKTSIDELPQLLNIFLGSMTLIGPRPIVPSEKELIKRRKEENVYSIKPGLTGLAQVNGRNNVTIEERVFFDSYYVKNIGFKLDVKIFFKTIVKVILQKDINKKSNK